MAHYGVKKQILGGLAGILARNTERLIFKGHLAFPVRHTVTTTDDSDNTLLNSII